MPVGDWIAAGKAGAKSVNDLFAVARDNSPDYGMIAKTGMNARSKERQVATKAKKNVVNDAIAAESRVRQAQTKADAAGEISDLKAGLTRKAGLVGALSAVAGGGLMAVENNRAKKVQAERDAKEEANWNAKVKMMSDFYNRDTTPSKGPELLEIPEYKPSTSTGSDSGSTSVSVATKPTTVGKVTAPSSRQAAFNEIYELAKKVGGTKFPEVVAAQSMHETGWLAAPDSVYKATGGTNPFGQTGDRGYGTIPRKGFKDGWTLYPDKETAVRDHIKLWHDTANHSGNYNAFDTIRDGLASVAPAYSPNSDPENIRKGYTVDSYSKGVRSALEEMGYSF